MKAVVHHKYGSPDVLRLEDVEDPVPGDGEVLIRTHASVVTAADCAFRSGDPFSARLFTGLIRPKATTLGATCAGEIEAVGKDVTRFSKDDQVVGVTSADFGAHAEYICLPEEAALPDKPANMTYAEAVAVCEGALTALPFLRDKAHVRSGQAVLVNGASGAVGVAGVQLAKYFGAHVTGVCSTASLALVKSLGADDVIDYTKGDFTRTDQTYDVIFDAVGKSSFSRCQRVLRKGGVYLTTVPSPAIFAQTLWTSRLGGKKAIIAFTGLRSASEKAKDLRFLKELAEAGKMKPVIDGRYPLERTAEAHTRVETGHKKGSVVITLERTADRNPS